MASCARPWRAGQPPTVFRMALSAAEVGFIRAIPLTAEVAIVSTILPRFNDVGLGNGNEVFSHPPPSGPEVMAAVEDGGGGAGACQSEVDDGDISLLGHFDEFFGGGGSGEVG